MALTDDAHALISEHFIDKTTSLAVDATCGNGHDTIFLCSLGFQKVVGFDVQTKAIEATRQRIENANINGVELILDSHQQLANYVESNIDCAMFNFGYLPSANKSVTTLPASSVSAISSACSLLSNKGIISLMCYPGTETGKKETQAIEQYLNTLASPWLVSTHLASSPKPTAPVLFLIRQDPTLALD